MPRIDLTPAPIPLPGRQGISPESLIAFTCGGREILMRRYDFTVWTTPRALTAAALDMRRRGALEELVVFEAWMSATGRRKGGAQ